MTTIYELTRSSARTLITKYPKVKAVAHRIETDCGLAHHTLAHILPQSIKPRARKLTVAITAHCNLRCAGCRYGRDFMPGAQLPLHLVKSLLTDARRAEFETVRLYGGEPLLHPDLAEMVEHAVGIGLSTYVTTNGILLRQKINALFDAGLRTITIGFYGVSEIYDSYVQRGGRYHRLEEGVAAVRDRYGSLVSLQMNYLLMRPSCNLKSLYAAWDFAQRYDMEFTTDLIHYSLPYFTEGENRELQFREEDRDFHNGMGCGA